MKRRSRNSVARALQELVGSLDPQVYDRDKELAWINRLPWHLRREFFKKSVPGIENRDRSYTVPFRPS